MMHPIYLPFSEDQVRSHFSRVKQGGQCISTDERHIEYYRRSIRNYEEYLAGNPERRGRSISEMRGPCQIEKDERFWVASSMMTIFYSASRNKEFIGLFACVFGDTPPIEGIGTWEDCFSGDLHLFFEPKLPSPKSYQTWLVENLQSRQIIPYVLDSAYKKKSMEGATNVDALLVNSSNGFGVLIEAKVLSDISLSISYDMMRNQIARNIDVMLEWNHDLCPPLNKRHPDRTLFLLVTPRVFKDNPGSRLYGYKMDEYRNAPDSLGQDLRHNKDRDWEGISQRIGWITWEGMKQVNPNCCTWIGCEPVQSCYSKEEDAYLESLVHQAEDTVSFLSSERKWERECWICAGFLKGLNEEDSERHFIRPVSEPPDVIYKEACFEVVMMVDDERRMHGEWKNEAIRRGNAICPSDLLEKYEAPTEMTAEELLARLEPIVMKKKGKYDARNVDLGKIDLLIYVNLQKFFLNIYKDFPDVSSFERQGWRSFSLFSTVYCRVLFAQESAPEFLRRHAGTTIPLLDPNLWSGT